MEENDDNDKDYAGRAGVVADAAKIYDNVVDAFEAKRDRDEAVKRYWDVYNCKLGDKQSYQGDHEIYIPVVRDAVEARSLRFTNALFPTNGRFVDCISTTDDKPFALEALINHYIRETRLRETCYSLARSGDVTGQYSLYVGWDKKKRKIMQRVEKPVRVKLDSGDEVSHETETYQDVEEVEVSSGLPDVWVIPDEDLAVLPATVDRIDDAEIVAVAMRVTADWLRERKDEWVPRHYKAAMDMLKGGAGNQIGRKSNAEKDRAKEAGVRSEKGVKTLLIYQIWCDLELDGERVPAVATAFAPGQFLSIKKNPYWSKRFPVISAPLKKVAGSFWGISPVACVEQLQYQANDAVNMGMDAAQYALMPIVMTDPLKNPRVGSMVLAMSAIWETNPADTEIVKFPPLWQDALGIIAATKAQIHESFGLNPAQMPMSGGPTRKPTQAQIAMEQQAALESTNDAVKSLESFVLTPLVQRIFEYDQQFRDDDMLIPQYGELGYEAQMDKVPPVQWGSRYTFLWAGLERNINIQRVQQMIAMMNVLRGIPPQQLNGRMIDIGPILDFAVDVTFGPRVAPKVLKDIRHQQTINPQIENEMMAQAMPATVNPADDDAAHIMAHHQAASMVGDPQGLFAAHMAQHQMQMQKKQAAMAPQGGQQGVPGGAAPGVAGTPKPGAVPAGPRQMKGPPGMIHPDQMPPAAGAMPRKM
ncbi:MAG: hypothetical protein KGL63_06610 [Betaproteobacteria bacterium]|nr:hypothetical protein [Betaproteobacteria bacterium]